MLAVQDYHADLVLILDTVSTMGPERRFGGDVPSPGGGDAGVTVELLHHARLGDRLALDRLFERYLGPLQRWARGRLPRWARDLRDTDDLVQDTLLQTFTRIDGFEPRREGALLAYLREALLNRIRDEIRRAGRRGWMAPAGSEGEQMDRGPSPLEAAIGREAVERYEAALLRLRPEEKEAIIARIEMGGSYDQVAAALGKPTADAARMAVGRALVRLAEEMRHGSR